MKRFLSLLICLLPLWACEEQKAELVVPPMPEAAKELAVSVQEVTSPGGVKAWLIEGHEAPVVALSFSFKGGQAYDPSGQNGLSSLTMSLLDEGAGDRDALNLRAYLENRAIGVSFDAERDHLAGKMHLLSSQKEAAFSILGEMLTKPRFDAEAIERMRAQFLAYLKRQEGDPQTEAIHAFFKQVFGDHPYGRPVPGTAEDMRALGKNDFKNLIRSRFAKENLQIAVCGDVTADELGQLLDKAFAALPESPDLPNLPDVIPQFDGKMHKIEAQFPQSVAVFGAEALPRLHDDFYSQYVMNYLLGGGSFSSRLMQELRQKNGLTYGISTMLVLLDKASLLMGTVASAQEKMPEALDRLTAEWQKMGEAGVSSEERASAVTYLTGAYPLRFASSAKTAAFMLAMQQYNLPPDYINDRNNYFRAVTKESIDQMARKILDPDKLTVTVVGNP